MKRAAALVALLVGAVWFGAAPASAQIGERIISYDVSIVVGRDATLSVTENIRYDFGSNERHGIYRDIPVRFDYDSRYERLNTIENVRVGASPPGTSSQTKVEAQGRLKRLRIGDPNHTITGVHDYTISYDVRGAMNDFPDHEELFWNAIGTEWPVPIQAATVRVQVDGTITQVACYAGPAGSRLPCTTADATGPAARFAQNDLSDYEGMSVVVGLPKGAVDVPPPILDEKWAPQRAFSATPATVGVSAGLMIVAIAGLARILGRGRDRRFAGSPVDSAFGNASGQEERVPLLGREHDPVEFEPPDKIRPGQIGTLIDEVANPLDVTATIIDLAVRGYLKIEEIPKHGIFGHVDWKLHKLKDADGLLAYERKLLNGLFESGDEVELSDLKRHFATRLHEVQNLLYDDVTDSGWFAGRPDKVRLKWRVLGVVLLIPALIVFFVLVAATHAGLVGIPFLVFGLGLLIGARHAPRRTAKGHAVLRRVNGFRQFIEESEKERARFAERANLFSEYLPYAVVFGATEKWAHAFRGLEDQVASSTGYWYVSPNPFAFGSFNHSVNSFATTTAGTIAASAASSGGSGFGGGGFSGGGFGGGGGGSW